MRRRHISVYARPRRVRGELRWELVEYRRGRDGRRGRTTHLLPRGATEARARRAVEIRRAQLGAEADAPDTWDEAVEGFLDERRRRGVREATLRAYEQALRAVERTLGELDPLTLGAADGERHVRARIEQGRSEATVLQEVQAVRILQRWLVERGHLERATWEDVRAPEAPPRQDHLGPDEIGALVRAAYRLAQPDEQGRAWPEWPAAVWVLLHGLRTSEAQHLLVGDLDLVHGVLWVRDRAGARTKTRQSARAVPVLAEEALRCLRATFRDFAPDEPCFHTGRPSGIARGRTKWFARRLARTCELAGVRHVSPHALRHTAATLAVSSGADHYSVAAMLGHDPGMVAKVYSHASAQARSQAAAQALGGWLDRVAGGRPVLEVVDGDDE